MIGVQRRVGDGLTHFEANAARMRIPALMVVMDWALHYGSAPMREFMPDQARFKPFTDDHAPVEMLIDTMMFSEAQHLVR